MLKDVFKLSNGIQQLTVVQDVPRLHTAVSDILGRSTLCLQSENEEYLTSNET